MSFKNFSQLVEKRFNEMVKDEDKIFTVSVDKDKMWELYLNSFPKGTNKIYRKRTEHDCSCCRHFIKSIGNVVSIKNGKVETIWDVDTNSTTYQPVADALKEYVLSCPIENVYITNEKSIGVKSNKELIENKIITYNHFHITVPNKFVNNSNKSIESIQGEYRSVKDVFKRSLDEITKESVLTVLELIHSNTLYKGNEWESILKEFLKYKKEYLKLTKEKDKDLFAWEMSIKAGSVIGKIKNHSIGVLLTNISEGMDLEKAVSQYEKIVAPSNYKRPKAIFTQKMLDEAKEKIEELGYMESLPRRFATVDDITVNNILFSNKDASKRIKGCMDIFDEMSKDINKKPMKFDRVEEVSAQTFIDKILPDSKEIELYLENKHSSNLMSLIAPVNLNSKSMFKWNNGFSWAYNGNMTDSMKETVKKYGGKVDGDLRFSIMWNDVDNKDNNDLDAHCKTPSTEIYFFHMKDYENCGELDVDIITPLEDSRALNNKGIAVENIIFEDRNNMKDGEYDMYVNVFSYRNGHSGFKAEIEFDGVTYHYEHEDVKGKKYIKVATVTLNHGKFSIKHHLKERESSKEIWGLRTNNFIPVNVICYSPNYWDEQNGNGNKHLFFMLDKCINENNPNGFFNEFLDNDLIKHKRVFEALGSKMSVEDSEEQLSGLGFCLSQRNEVILKVTGNVERIIKVKF